MLPIFKMQVQHILRGKRKWFVVLLLLMPVLLTYVAMEVGGLGELKRTLEKKEETAGEPDQSRVSPGASPVMVHSSPPALSMWQPDSS